MKKDNSFIKGAIILGLSFFIAVFIIKPVGVSTQFSVLSGIVHSSIDRNVIMEDASSESGYISTNEYYNKNGGKLAEEIKNPWNYGFVFVLAIPAGSFLGYLVMRKRKIKQDENYNTNEGESCRTGSSPIRRYIISFIGGFILLFGARMADGCTSGHMMSGMMQGSISGYAFAASAFFTAIPTAVIVGRLSERGGKK